MASAGGAALVSVRVEWLTAGVAEVVLDRPDALSALSTQQARDLSAACAGLASDERVRAVVLTSTSPRAFCVGADLKERAEFTEEQLMDQRPVFRAAFAGVRDLPVPTLAAVEGYALGGGCELALSCDLIVASDSAVLGLPEVGVGLVPGGGGTQLLTRRVGYGRAADLLFTARRVPADEAYRLGLVDRRVLDGTARETALRLAAEITRHSPVALRHAKSALREGANRPLSEALEIEDQAWRATAASPDRVEGIAAFIARRPPRWPGPPAES